MFPVLVPFMSLVSVPFMALNQVQDQVQVRGPVHVLGLGPFYDIESSPDQVLIKPPFVLQYPNLPCKGPGGGLSGIHPGTIGDNKGLWGKISSVYE